MEIKTLPRSLNELNTIAEHKKYTVGKCINSLHIKPEQAIDVGRTYRAWPTVPSPSLKKDTAFGVYSKLHLIITKRERKCFRNPPFKFRFRVHLPHHVHNKVNVQKRKQKQ